MTIQHLHSGPRLSQAVIHNGTVYLAGQVATDFSADLKGQCIQILAQIDTLLAAAGTDKSKLLSATIYLTDIHGFPVMNEVWEGWVVPGRTPARTTVEAKLAGPQYLVEMTIVAAL